MTMRKSGILFIMIILSGLFGPGLLAADTKVATVEKSFPLTAGRPVTVSFHDSDGDVKFAPSEDGAVHLKVWKETDVRDGAQAQRLLDEITVDVSQNGNDIRIEIRRPHVRWFFFGLSDSSRVRVRSEVVLPGECRLTATTSDGTITAARLKGDLSFKTSDGEIRLTDAEGRVQARSSDGAIDLDNVRGDVEAHASDGDITVSGVLTGLNLRTSDGDISVRVLPGSRMASDWEIGASDGSIEAALSPDFASRLWLHTSDGDINCVLPVSVEGKTTRHDVRGMFGAGGSLLTVKTSDGDITLRPLPSSLRRP
jgi:DUF4097 and DUF4098 domain-containing protein YvlB